jgi:hypothetical protein
MFQSSKSQKITTIFNQEACNYLMKKENLPNKLFRKCNGHSKYCFESDFGVKHSFCVP